MRILHGAPAPAARNFLLEEWIEMSSRRTNFIKDRQRNSRARRDNRKAEQERLQQQAQLVTRLRREALSSETA